MRWYLALLLFTSFGPLHLWAQEGPCTRRTIAVGVVDRQWNLVEGLKAGNFRGKVGGRDVQVLSAVLDNGPRRIVVLLDASGSMIGSGELWETEKAFSECLIRFGPPRASIALMAFAAIVLDTENFEQDPLALTRNLHSPAECVRAAQDSGADGAF